MLDGEDSPKRLAVETSRQQGACHPETMSSRPAAGKAAAHSLPDCTDGVDALQARQKWHITADKGFASSSNARNELMLRDAGEFAGHIKRCEKDIRVLKNATEGDKLISSTYQYLIPSHVSLHTNLWSSCNAGLINTTKAVMSAPLPKVYEDCGNGTAQPIATTQGLSGAIGGDFKVDELQRVSKETVRSVFDHVSECANAGIPAACCGSTQLHKLCLYRPRNWRQKCLHPCRDGQQLTTQSRLA